MKEYSNNMLCLFYNPMVGHCILNILERNLEKYYKIIENPSKMWTQRGHGEKNNPMVIKK